MRAWQLLDKGGPESLEYDEVAVPYVGIGDALIRVHAASFTPDELNWPSTWVDRRGMDRRPVIPGHEVSGVVEELGSGTTGLAVGDHVYGLTDWYRDGTAAELVAVEARNLALKPGSLTHVEAAAVPMPGLTAWQALFDHGGLVAGQTVLIHGAAGGVGSLAVQLARHAGATVVGTGRAPSRQLVLELGADVFVDVGASRLEEEVQDVDLAVDLVGSGVVAQSSFVVRSGGTIVSVVENAPNALERHDVRGVFFIVEARSDELREVSQLIDLAELRPVVGDVVPLADGQGAFERKRGGGIRGKTVLNVEGA
jgi:NADPH:quinone reductase-like Zn-dependent oxidoreductase